MDDGQRGIETCRERDDAFRDQGAVAAVGIRLEAEEAAAGGACLGCERGQSGFEGVQMRREPAPVTGPVAVRFVAIADLLRTAKLWRGNVPDAVRTGGGGQRALREARLAAERILADVDQNVQVVRAEQGEEAVDAQPLVPDGQQFHGEIVPEYGDLRTCVCRKSIALSRSCRDSGVGRSAGTEAGASATGAQVSGLERRSFPLPGILRACRRIVVPTARGS